MLPDWLLLRYIPIYFLCSTLLVETKSSDHATMIMNSLSVDKVLYPERANRMMTVEGNTLKMFAEPSSFFIICILFSSEYLQQLM